MFFHRLASLQTRTWGKSIPTGDPFGPRVVGVFVLRTNIDAHSLVWVIVSGREDVPGAGSSSTRTKTSGRTAGEPVVAVVQELQRPPIPLNLILAGPPGTGKTYTLRTKYVPLFEEHVPEQTRILSKGLSR